MVTHWLPITSILSVTGIIYSNQFKCNYLTSKFFFWLCCCFSELYIKFWTVWGKWLPLELVYFRKYGLIKAWLGKRLKRPISENSFRVNMLRRRKHCWNLHDSTFIIIFHHSERDWVAKMFLLVICKTLGLFVNTLTNIFFATGRIYGRNNLWICSYFSEFYIKFWTFRRRRLPSGLAYLWKEGLRKTWLDKYFKSPVLEHFATVNMLKCPKHCQKLSYILINWREVAWWNVSPCNIWNLGILC